MKDIKENNERPHNRVVETSKQVNAIFEAKFRGTNPAEIRKVMSAVFDVPLDKINDESSSDNIESWDSLRHLNLILAIEEEFDIIIPDMEVANLVNFKLIELIVNEYKK